MGLIEKEGSRRRRRLYDVVFKRDAVRLVSEEKFKFKAAAAAVNVSEPSLRAWHAKFVPPPETCGEHATVDQLRDENARLRGVRAIKCPALQHATEGRATTAGGCLGATVREQLGRKRRLPRSAIDSTGLEAAAFSGHFIRRRDQLGRPRKDMLHYRFPKLGIVWGEQTGDSHLCC